jgi:hypothetical protein
MGLYPTPYAAYDKVLRHRRTEGKVKDKVDPVPFIEHHAMKANWGIGGIAPRPGRAASIFRVDVLDHGDVYLNTEAALPLKRWSSTA